MSPDVTGQPADLAGWLTYLEQLHPTAIAMGLDRVHAVARRMGVTSPAPQSILVAGTNGKGTTCAVIEQVLLATGKRVGVYSSPHLMTYEERVRVNGDMLPAAAHCAAFAAVDAARGEISLTYFEFGTLAAFYLMQQAGVDVAVIEVGLGGRLDATNIVDADVAVITTIDLDHQAFLGNSRESVGAEKVGICRSGKPLVIGEIDPPRTISEGARERGAQPVWFGRDYQVSLADGRWSLATRAGEQWTNLPIPQVPLVNAATALMALRALGVSLTDAVLASVLPAVRLPGRLQTVGESPLRLVDVAHNPHAARYLAVQLSVHANAGRRIVAVTGAMADKDLDGLYAPLVALVDRWYLAAPHIARAARPERLREALPASVNAQVMPSVASAWQQAVADSAQTDVVIGFGSFYTVAEILQAEQARSGN